MNVARLLSDLAIAGFYTNTAAPDVIEQVTKGDLLVSVIQLDSRLGGGIAINFESPPYTYKASVSQEPSETEEQLVDRFLNTKVFGEATVANALGVRDRYYESQEKQEACINSAVEILRSADEFPDEVIDWQNVASRTLGVLVF